MLTFIDGPGQSATVTKLNSTLATQTLSSLKRGEHTTPKSPGLLMRLPVAFHSPGAVELK